MVLERQGSPHHATLSAPQPSRPGRFVIACGGTGGHLFPGIAVAEVLRSRGHETLLFISEKQVDSLAAEGYGHLRFEKIPSMAMPRPWSAKMPGFLLGFAKGYRRCANLIRDFKADVILGMGGFTSTAPLIAGWRQGCRTYVHESNAIPGKANLLNARFCRKVLVGWQECASHFKKTGREIIVTGTPLRPRLLIHPKSEDAVRFFGLDPERRILAVMGGSQGARRLNQLVCAARPALEAAGIGIIHITGPADFAEMVKMTPGAAAIEGHSLRPFLAEMENAYAAADIVLCRSGASTLSELAAFGLPSVLVPYPFAAADHQTLNARIFSEAGAAECWPQGELDESTFPARLLALCGDDAKLKGMRDKMRELGKTDAALRVCEVLEGDAFHGASCK